MRSLFPLTKLLVLLILTQACYGTAFFTDHTRGWHWYEPIPLIEEQLEQKEEKKEKEGVSSFQESVQLTVSGANC